MQTKSIIEALLFMHGEAMELKELRGLLELSDEEISDAVSQLADEYHNRGLVLIQKDGAVEIGSHPDAHAYVEKLVKSEFTEGLSRSRLETLAIVAYKGPLSRPEIDYIRISGEIINMITNTNYYTQGKLNTEYKTPYLTFDGSSAVYEFETDIVYLYSNEFIDTILLQSYILQMITDEFLDKTIKVWQPHFKDALTKEDARQIIETAYSVVKTLAKWEAERKGGVNGCSRYHY